MAPRRSTRQKSQETSQTATKTGRVTKHDISIEDKNFITSSVNLPKGHTQVKKPSKRKVMKNIVAIKTKETKIQKMNKNSKGIEDEEKLREIQELKYMHRQCQTCLKLYDNYFRAECCFRSHGDRSLKCYFCVTFFSDTHSLFEHYNNGPHAKGTKEDTIVCKFCNKTVNYSKVSVHFISDHLSEDEFAPR